MYPHLGSFEECIMKGLYMWYSCLGMKKLCRRNDIHGLEPQSRLEIHDLLVDKSKSNLSIRNGLSGSKLFRMAQVRENPQDWDFSWIPEDSPSGCYLTKRYSFPKRVGIVFIEIRKSGKQKRQEDKFLNILKKTLKKPPTKPSYSLDCDQDACAYLLLQRNKHQSIFEFQIVELRELPEWGSHLLYWLDDIALKGSKSIDYWIAITSEKIPGREEGYHFDTMEIEETYSCKRLWLITTLGWERDYSPPSVFNTFRRLYSDAF
jgi:hypothetical protein